MAFIDAKFWLAVAFFAFLLVIYKFAWPILSKMISGKVDQVAKELKEAKEAKEKAENLLKQAEESYEQSLKDSKKIIAQAEQEAKKLIEDSSLAVEDEVNRKIEALNERLKSEEERAVRNIKVKIVNTAMESVKENLSKVDQEKLQTVVTKSIDDISKIIH